LEKLIELESDAVAKDFLTTAADENFRLFQIGWFPATAITDLL